MTLRLRLVLGLALLTTIGLAVFGVVTFSLYSSSQYARLDDRLRSSVPLLSFLLRDEAGLGPGAPPAPGPSPGGNQTAVVPLATYAQLRDSSGTLLSTVQLSRTQQRPKLPRNLSAEARKGRVFTVASDAGSGSWRVLVDDAGFPLGGKIVVAVPTSEVEASLDRLVVIEVGAGAGLLALLGAGSWLILRRGLRPLEQMATAARAITAGDLSERVTTDDARTEVGQLGVALNTMLDEIEAAFRVRDATEQRLRQFLSDASHELRTPITSIKGFAELFRLGLDRDPEELGRVLRRIEDETERMNVLVDDLLLLARLDETRPTVRAPVDLAVLAAEVCSDAAAQSPGRPITLDAASPVVVLGDADHLRQAIANLVGNALKHTPPEVAVEVGARINGRSAAVTVRDHGPGLGDEALRRAFDRFWQADEARAGPGAGLGLAIVAGIADEHGGSASVTNEKSGGARFTLQVPVNATD